jgi:hypothetical protein
MLGSRSAPPGSALGRACGGPRAVEKPFRACFRSMARLQHCGIHEKKRKIAYDQRKLSGSMVDVGNEGRPLSLLTRLRITSLATNAAASATYERGGFVPYEIIYGKPTGGDAA